MALTLKLCQIFMLLYFRMIYYFIHDHYSHYRTTVILSDEVPFLAIIAQRKVHSGPDNSMKLKNSCKNCQSYSRSLKKVRKEAGKMGKKKNIYRIVYIFIRKGICIPLVLPSHIQKFAKGIKKTEGKGFLSGFFNKRIPRYEHWETGLALQWVL
jgi:hypothetical protein